VSRLGYPQRTVRDFNDDASRRKEQVLAVLRQGYRTFEAGGLAPVLGRAGPIAIGPSPETICPPTSSNLTTIARALEKRDNHARVLGDLSPGERALLVLIGLGVGDSACLFVPASVHP